MQTLQKPWDRILIERMDTEKGIFLSKKPNFRAEKPTFRLEEGAFSASILSNRIWALWLILRHSEIWGPGDETVLKKVDKNLIELVINTEENINKIKNFFSLYVKTECVGRAPCLKKMT
jgi:hypothetical protein